jgi:hypothetical protein
VKRLAIHLLLLLAAPAFAASAQPPRCSVDRCPRDLADKLHAVTYADGSANRYLLGQGQLEYVPVKPEQSSTGYYDGGPAWKVALTAAQLAAIAEAIDRGIAATAAHVKSRGKGTGLLEIRCGDERVSWILGMRSPEKAAIEDALKKARPAG